MKDEALKLALEAHQAMREWIDAVPDDTVLPTMPGCDRDWLDTVEATIKQALAAPTVQEPVAYLFTNVQSGDIEASTNPDHKEGEREMWYREPLVRPPAQPAPVQLDAKDWTPCMKLPVVVHVRQQRPGEAHVSTREGITPVKPDDLIMRGVSGEEYPIGRAIFEQTYTLDTTPPAQPAPVQEPSGFFRHEDVCGDEVGPPTPYYLTPPAAQRQWVGLTDEEHTQIAIDSGCMSADWVFYGAAVERKVKEKNF